MPFAPTVTEIVPSRLREGELRPILLRGTGFARPLRVTAHEPGNLLTPTPFLQVRQTAFDPAAPSEFGVLLKSHPDLNLPAGTPKNYVLRLAYVGSPAATVNITVDGLDEKVLANGQTETISTPSPNQRIFSRIEIGAGAVLDSRVRVLAWQATDRVEILGSVRSIGEAGVNAFLQNGGGTTHPAPGGAGIGGNMRSEVFSLIVTQATAGSPALTANLNDFLPGTLGSLFGQPGATGYNPSVGGFGFEDPLAAVSELMYPFFARDRPVHPQRGEHAGLSARLRQHHHPPNH